MSKGLTKHQLEIISEVACKEGIKHVEQREQRKKAEQRERNLTNTDLLMKNYTKLKAMAEEYKNEVDDYEDTVLDLSTLNLETLEKYHFKTVKIMKHVDTMLHAYEVTSRNGSPEELRRFEVLKYRYLSPKRLTVKELCERLNVEQTAIYRDTKLAIRDMSVLIFGAAAIDFA